jgi:hypothetical protein
MQLAQLFLDHELLVRSMLAYCKSAFYISITDAYLTL